MHRIDGAGHVNNLFVAENAGINRPPTEVTAEIMNAFQEELAGFIQFAGLVLNKADNTQLKQALLLSFLSADSLAVHLGAADPHPVYLTTAEGDSKIAAAVAALVNSSPAALDTLSELATALGNDPNFATTITNALAAKAALAVAQTWTKAQRGAVTALIDAATIAVDLSLSNNFSITLGGNRTLGSPTNAVAGQSGVITVTQDGTGSRTLAYGSNYKAVGGIANLPALSTAAGTVDHIAYYVETATRIRLDLGKNVS